MSDPRKTGRLVESNDLLPRVAATIRAGGQQTLQKPPVFTCSDQTHEPFRVLPEPLELSERDPFLLGMVQTTGQQFAGDRTDIHDVFSLIWGAVLRAFGIASARLLDEPHMFVPSEIGARYLLFHQCPWRITASSFEVARKSLNAWSAFAFHLLDDVFQWSRAPTGVLRDVTTRQNTRWPLWIDSVSRYLSDPTDATISRRKFPRWSYFSSQDRGVTVVRLTKARIFSLRVILMPFAPQVADGQHSYPVFANGIPNAIPYELDDKTADILSLTSDRCSHVLAVPLDSHCLFIGDRTIVAWRGEYGREKFEHERQRMMARRTRENRVFMAEARVEWRTSLNPGDLEDLCADLIGREPGVVRAKPVGRVSDRDGGRDILIDRKVPNEHASAVNIGASEDPTQHRSSGTKVVRVIAQVKSRSRSIGKADVQDIRDMLEHYQAEGFLLVGYPRISTALVDYLDRLGKTLVRTDWWEARDLEERLRRHPDIAKRYPQLVTLHAGP